VNSGLYLRLYYMAQDFHERASSSHYPYGALVDAFFHSDVLYRCQRLLDLQGQACARLGEAIRLRRPFVYGESNQQAGRDLADALAYLRDQQRPQWQRLLGSLDLLVHNLRSIERRLLDAERSEASLDNVDTRLRDSNPHTLREMGVRVRQQLTPGSVLFRHGLRMALALIAGFAAIRLFNAQNGSWVLLTIVFVCRPNFGATRQRLAQRIVGTVAGLVLTWALLQLFPQLHVQLLIALLSALLFFFTRTDRYLVASAAITVMALTCFNLIGDGFVLIVPRMVDTLLGCAIAAAAAFLILPDWQGRQLHLVLARVLDTAARYLDSVLGQYRSGMRDDLAYRIARRDMHNADAALSTALSNMLREPGHVRRNLDAGFHFLALSNTLLGHLSALGAHRDQVDSYAGDPLALAAGERVRKALQQLASALTARQPVADDDNDADRAVAAELEQIDEAMPPKLQLIRTQMALVLRMLPKVRAAANEAVTSLTCSPDGMPPGMAWIYRRRNGALRLALQFDHAAARILGNPLLRIPAMKIELSGRTALVTASTAGIGLAIAQGLASAGARSSSMAAAPTASNAPASAARRRAGADVLGVAADLSDAAGVETLLAGLPKVDILVNNAGIFGPEDFFETDDATWERYWQTNVMSGVRLSRALLPAMVDAGWGRVLFISSESARNIPADMIHYGVSKTAQLSLSRGLAKRVAGSGVTVNAVLPGPTLSDGFAAMFEDERQRSGKPLEQIGREFVMAHRPSSVIQRTATVEEVANMVVYLASPQASATSGAALRVDGGVVDDIV
jgi:uncharacterized membrane protein YccC/NAD(P)-dependent dehydrogenase (short-subunit alcohol dehydrogenase family)